ncbi:MAG: ABC transporter ATP-binding protein [Pseudomonadales bacterium]|jgi:ATP-binding cassette subfamily B protein|nr:ABC transporter ATP-binding protein [Pseudomonadales bacterium]
MARPLQDDLWNLTQGYRRLFGLAVLALGAASALTLFVPLVAKYAIDVAIEGDLSRGIPVLAALVDGSTHALPAYLLASGLAVVLVTVLGGAFHYLRGRATAEASEGLVRRMRTLVHRHVEHLPAHWHDGMETGDLVQRCSSDVETLRVFFAQDLVEIGRGIVLLLVLLPMLFWLDWQLALVSVSLIPLIFLFAWLFYRRVQQVFTITDEAEAELTACLQENLTGIRVVRAFSRQGHEIERFAAHNAAFRDHNQRLIDLMAVFWSVSDLLCLSQLGLVLVVGGSFVAEGRLSVGDLFAFLTWIMIVLHPIRMVGRILTDAGKANVSRGRLAEVLDAPLEEARREHTPALRGAIELRHLTFAYPGGAPVLDDVTLAVAPGETVGLVGPPGAGKTTLIRLLLGLYDAPEGTILLDDVPMEEIDRETLRGQLSVVLQEPFLYSRTLEENLRVGRDHASAAALAGVVDDAALTETLASFPEGMATAIGERGVRLSGGQRQRLALARALLREPAVLVLDDALSAVDAHTETHILERLSARRGRQTTLIVAHRLSAVRDADRIHVLHEGRIVQSGDHDSLVARDGPYRALARQQGMLDEPLDADGDGREREGV